MYTGISVTVHIDRHATQELDDLMQDCGYVPTEKMSSYTRTTSNLISDSLCNLHTINAT